MKSNRPGGFQRHETTTAAPGPRLRQRTARPPEVNTADEPWASRATVLTALAALVVLAVGSPLVLIAVLAALVLALLGPRQAIQALAIIVVVKFLNDRVYAWPPAVGAIAWLMLLVATLRVLPRMNARSIQLLVPLWAFVLVVAALTPINSSNPSVSLFKLAAFAAGTTGVLVASLGLRSADARLLRAWLPSVALAVALFSLLTLPFPGVSQARVPGSIQGILNHPQTFGAFLAPLAALHVGRLVFGRKSFRSWEGGVLLLVAALMVASGTRTAVIAVALGVGTAMFVLVFGERAQRKQAFRGGLVAIVIAAVLSIAVLASSELRDIAVGFVFKRGYGDSVEDAFMASRGIGIESQWKNFLAQPLVGHGFGIYPGGEWVTKPVMFMGLPISAPVEKGFLPTALLEEVGVLGALLFVAFVAALLRHVVRTRDPAWLGVVLTCLLVNIGEAVLFSMGGLGLYFWLWIGLGMRGVAPLPEESPQPRNQASARSIGLPRETALRPIPPRSTK